MRIKEDSGYSILFSQSDSKMLRVLDARQAEKLELLILRSFYDGDIRQNEVLTGENMAYTPDEVSHYTRVLIACGQLEGQIIGSLSEIVGRPTAAGIARLRAAGMI